MIFAFAIIYAVPEEAWVAFIFLVFKVSIESLIWRTVGNNDHLNPDLVKEYSSFYAFIAKGWPLSVWIYSKALFFVPTLIGFPIPYFDVIFSFIVLARSAIALQMLNWHAKDVFKGMSPQGKEK